MDFTYSFALFFVGWVDIPLVVFRFLVCWILLNIFIVIVLEKYQELSKDKFVINKFFKKKTTHAWRLAMGHLFCGLCDKKIHGSNALGVHNHNGKRYKNSMSKRILTGEFLEQMMDKYIEDDHHDTRHMDGKDHVTSENMELWEKISKRLDRIESIFASNRVSSK